MLNGKFLCYEARQRNRQYCEHARRATVIRTGAPRCVQATDENLISATLLATKHATEYLMLVKRTPLQHTNIGALICPFYFVHEWHTSGNSNTWFHEAVSSSDQGGTQLDAVILGTQQASPAYRHHGHLDFSGAYACRFC